MYIWKSAGREPLAPTLSVMARRPAQGPRPVRRPAGAQRGLRHQTALERPPVRAVALLGVRRRRPLPVRHGQGRARLARRGLARLAAVVAERGPPEPGGPAPGRGARPAALAAARLQGDP